MLAFLHKSWFLTVLFLLIPTGLWLGLWLPMESNPVLAQIGPWSKLLTPLVLFLMSVTLNSGRMWAVIKSPGAVLWATCVTFAFIPLLALPLLPLQLHPDYTAGLMVAASVPCTMAAASVWTRKADGNDAVSMLVTILTNGLCFLVTPLWLKLGIGRSVELDTVAMVWKLMLSALLPIVLGQLARAVPSVCAWADRLKTPLGVVAQLCILLTVFWAAILQGPKLFGSKTGGGLLAATVVVVVCVVVLHCCGLWIAHFGGRRLGFSRADIVAVTFAGSQKTLPIGIYVATELLTDVPFAVYPMLMFHALQLLIDTLILDRLMIWKQAMPPDPAT